MTLLKLDENIENKDIFMSPEGKRCLCTRPRPSGLLLEGDFLL